MHRGADGGGGAAEDKEAATEVDAAGVGVADGYEVNVAYACL